MTAKNQSSLSPSGRLGTNLSDQDCVSDWSLDQFRRHYQDDSINKDDIWHYIYGVMHAPDWRQRYRIDLKKSWPRIPLASDFKAFIGAGQQLMGLHINYEMAPEYPLKVEPLSRQEALIQVLDDEDRADRYRFIKLRWGKTATGETDRSKLVINAKYQLVGIPEVAHEYQISGRSPLQWAIDSYEPKAGSDPNNWHVWADDSAEFIKHLKRLCYISVETAKIVSSLPPSLDQVEPKGDPRS